MHKLLHNLSNFFTHKDELSAIRGLQVRCNLADTHIIALSRLMLIKPERLYTEVNNSKPNLDYINQLIEAKSHAEANLSKEA
jgi:hypothetical protein